MHLVRGRRSGRATARHHVQLHTGQIAHWHPNCLLRYLQTDGTDRNGSKLIKLETIAKQYHRNVLNLFAIENQLLNKSERCILESLFHLAL